MPSALVLVLFVLGLPAVALGFGLLVTLPEQRIAREQAKLQLRHQRVLVEQEEMNLLERQLESARKEVST